MQTLSGINAEAQEKLLGLAIRSEKALDAVAQLPQDHFSEQLAILHHAFKQAKTDGVKPTRGAFQSDLSRIQKTPAEVAGQLAIFNRCQMIAVAVKEDELPALLRASEVESTRMKAKNLLKAGKIEEALPLFAATGAKPEIIERAKAALAKKNSGRLKTARMSDIEEKTLEWFWPQIIPLGGLTVIAGEGESGKSTLVSSIAARVTNGQDWPDGAAGADPCEVLYVGVEEDVERVLRPRLRLFGANLEKIHYAFGISEIRDGKEVLMPWRFEQLDALRQTLAENQQIRMVVFDPIGVYFGSADSYKDSEIQALLQPLSKLGQELGVTMVAIAHLGKNETRSIKNRILGSVAIPNTARTVIGVIRDKMNQTSYMGVCKTNYNSKRTTIPYQISDNQITFGAELNKDIDSLLKTTTGDEGRGSQDRGIATEIIKTELADGPKPSESIKAKCRAVGISDRTAERAAVEIGVIKERENRFGGSSLWALTSGCDSPF